MVRVLLTGAAGFIGTAIARRLTAAGDDVVGVDLMIEQAHGRRPADPGPGVVIGDVRDEALLTRLLDGVDVVCHQAAMVGLGVHATDAPGYVSHNALGTATLLSAMTRAGVRRLVLASSMVVYGEGRYRCVRHEIVRPGPRSAADLAAGRFDPPCPVCGEALRCQPVPEDAPADPRNTYAATKLAQEHLASAWANQVGGSVTALRYHNVYGPGMPHDTPYAGVAAIFRSALERGEAPTVLEDGRQLRDFVHADDVALANRLALLRAIATPPPADGEVLACNVCSGEPHTVGELAGALSTALDGLPPRVVGGGRAGDVRHVVADPARAERVLGFRAEVPFAAGIAGFAHAPMRPAAPPPGLSRPAAAVPRSDSPATGSAR